MTADSTTTHFPNINNSNYAEWALWMEAVLVCAGLWSMINVRVDTDGKTADEITQAVEHTNMSEARAEIILRVEDGQLAHCM